MKTRAVFRWILFFFSVTLTTIWLVLCGAYLMRLGWNGILSLEPSALALILTASASPPLLMWLVLVVLTQQNEIVNFREILLELTHLMRRQFEQSEANVKVLLEMTSSSRRQFVKDGLSIILNDLSSNVAIVADRTGVLSGDNLDLAWAKYGAGDCWSLMRPFVDRASLEQGFDLQLKNAIMSDQPSMVAASAFVRRVDSLYSENLITTREQKILFDILKDSPLEKVVKLLSIDEELLDHFQEASESSNLEGLESHISIQEGMDSEQNTISDNISTSQKSLFPDTT